MRMMIIDDENDGDDENCDDYMMLITTTIIIIFSAIVVFKSPLQIHYTPYLNIAMRIISSFQDSRTRQGHPLLTHLARYSAEVPNSQSASTWLQPPQITH